MPSISKYVEDINLVLTLAVVAGLFYPVFSEFFIAYIVLLLIVIMTLSTAQIKFGELEDIRREFKQVLTGFLISYGFVSGIVFALTIIFISDPNLKAGFIIMAAVPSAVAVIPLTGILKGNQRLSLISSSFIYVMSPLMATIIIFLGLGSKVVDPVIFIKVLLELILLPLVLSRLLIRLKSYPEIKKVQKTAINLCFFVLIYGVVGVNRDVYFGKPYIVLMVSGICFFRTFVSGTVIYLLARWRKVDRSSTITYALFGTFKNMGIAATMALVLINKEAMIPAAIAIPFEIMTFVYLSKLVGDI
ncbi:MAG: bile acid:sodium symporter family protein [Candidatus Hydrothermarchaeales archaeon]